MKKFAILIAGLMMSMNSMAASDFENLPGKKQTPQKLYVTAKQAHEMVSNNAENMLFVDVRTRPELEFVGYTNMVDANIPYMMNDLYEFDDKKQRFKKVPNSNFSVVLEDVLTAKGLTKDSTVILMCRSGSRSSKAASLLNKIGYTNVYTVVDGFEGDKAKSGPNKGKRLVNGWKNAELPWSYKLNMAKMYFE